LNSEEKLQVGKKTFVEHIKSTKVETPSEGGGNYWISSLSAIGNSYKKVDLSIINDKIDELAEKLSGTKRTITKDMYQRNIDILKQYKALGLKKIRPPGKIGFLKKSTASSL
jgi:hypothetical protein